MFKAILWDNDGVLVDTERLYFQATREQLSRVGVTLTEADYVEYFLRQSRGAWHLAHALGVSEAETDALRAARDVRYVALIESAPTLLPGVSEALAALAGRFRMAIVTSSQPAPFAAIHRSTGILPHFEFALTRVDYAESKPHPEPYLRAIGKLALAPAECLVIEDSERGLAAARAAGLTCWIVPSQLSQSCRFEGADRVLADLDAVVAALGS
jgi:HAD superfamily hydrolase (TIGR01509 family)